MEKVIDIVVTSYNRKSDLKKCLDSLVKYNTADECNIIVSDVGSSDGSVDLAQHYADAYEHISVIKHENKLSFAQNVNFVARKTTSPFLIFLNDDSEVTENWLTPLLDAFDNENVGMAVPIVLQSNNKIASCGANLRKDGWSELCLSNTIYDRNQEDLYQTLVDVVAYAAFYVVRRDVFEKVGFLSEFGVPVFWDDTDLGMKINAVGMDCKFVASSVIYHMHSETNRGNHNKASVVGREWFMNRWSEFLEKNNGYNPMISDTKPFLNGKEMDKYNGEVYNPLPKPLNGEIFSPKKEQ